MSIFISVIRGNKCHKFKVDILEISWHEQKVSTVLLLLLNSK